MGSDLGTTDEANMVSLIYATRRVLGSVRDSYRTKRLWREAARNRRGCPVTTGGLLAGLSARTVDCRVVPIVVPSAWKKSRAYRHLLC
jgi:hypothetical protein